MTKFHKRLLCLAMLYIGYIAVIMGVTLLLRGPSDTSFLGQISSDKVYSYLLVPPLLCGIFIIDESMKKPLLIRMGSRRRALLRLLAQQYLFTMIYVSVWFGQIALFARLGGETFAVIGLLGEYGRYLLSLLLLVNCAELFKRLNSMAVPAVLFGASFILLLIDVLFIPTVTNRFGPPVRLLFSWAFPRRGLSYLILAAWLVITFVSLLNRNDTYDIF